MSKTFAIAILVTFTVNLLANCAPVGASKRDGTAKGTGGDSTSSPAPPASAGTSDRGGGGRGVRCLRDGKVSVELLDLYEARSMHGLTLIKSPANETAAVDLFASLLGRQLWTPGSDMLEERINFFRGSWKKELMSKTHFLGASQHLKLSSDSHDPVLEDNCVAVQVALYYDESSLMVDSSLWDQMDWLNRVALFTHEFVYKVARLGGEHDSISSRKFVSFLFSTQGLKPISVDMPSNVKEIDSCALIRNGVSDGFVKIFDRSVDNFGGIEIVFLQTGSRNYLFKTSAQFLAVNVKLINAAEETSNPFLKSEKQFNCTNHCGTSDLRAETYPDPLAKYSFGADEMGRFFLMPEKANPEDRWLLHCGPSDVH